MHSSCKLVASKHCSSPMLAYKQQTNNNKFRWNQEIFSKSIDCLNFVDNLNFCDTVIMEPYGPLYKHWNPGVFRGLLEFVRYLDDSLKNYFLISSVFRETSKTIKNELLDCILEVHHDEICVEIKQYRFLSVMLDNILYVSGIT